MTSAGRGRISAEYSNLFCMFCLYFGVLCSKVVDCFPPVGGTVHLVCRNKDRADAAKEEIVEKSKNQVKYLLSNREN